MLVPPLGRDTMTTLPSSSSSPSSLRADLVEGLYRLVELFELLHPQPLALAYKLQKEKQIIVVIVVVVLF